MDGWPCQDEPQMNSVRHCWGAAVSPQDSAWLRAASPRMRAREFRTRPRKQIAGECQLGSEYTTSAR